MANKQCIGFLFSTALNANMRFASKEVVEQFLDRMTALYGENDTSVVKISYNADAARELVFCAVPADRYIDVRMGDDSQTWSWRYNYVMLSMYPNSAMKGDDVTPTSFGAGLEHNAFFARVDHIENSKLQRNMCRIYFTVDWWTTMLYAGGKFTVEGSVLRAHVDDIRKTTTGQYFPTFENFTNETEFSLAPYQIRAVSTPVKNDFEFTNSTLSLSDDEAGDLKKIEKKDIAFLVFSVRNLSGMIGYSEWINGSYGRPTRFSLKSLVGSGGATIYPNNLGSVFFCPIIMTSNGSPAVHVCQFESDFTIAGLDNINDDRFLSMYITANCPIIGLRVDINKNSGLSFGIDTSINGDYGNTFSLYPIRQAAFKKNETQYYLVCFPIIERTLKIDDMLQGFYVDDIYDYNSDISNGIADENWDAACVKAHVYPYSYYTLSSYGNTIIYDTTIHTFHSLYVNRDQMTGSWECFVAPRTTKGWDTQWNLSDFNYYFQSIGIFAPYFSESWLERLNALDEAAHASLKADYGVASTVIKTVGNAVGSILSGNWGKLVSGLASGALDTGEAVIDAQYTKKIAARNTMAIESGYNQTGSVPTQASVGLMSRDLLYVTVTTPATAILPEGSFYKESGRKALLHNLRLYGYTTNLPLSTVLKMPREYFNYVVASECTVIFEGADGVNAPFGSTTEAQADVCQMFESGVWLIQRYDETNEKNLLDEKLFNIQKGLKEV